MNGKDAKKNNFIAIKGGRKPSLNHEQKMKILEKRNQGFSLRQIAKEFCVSYETIRQVKPEEKTSEKIENEIIVDFEEFEESNFDLDKVSQTSKKAKEIFNGLEKIKPKISTGVFD